MTNQSITKVTVTDFMGIGGTVELYPEGSLQVIAGPNGSGKSSLIHAIEECIDPQGTRIIPKPIHEGATEARVEIETTEARIVRVWKKADAGTLSAYALDGAKYPSGKAFVAEITGGILFDPDDFVRLSEKEQREQLLAKVTLPFDLDEVTAKRKSLFDGRTDKTREVKRLVAQLAGYAPADSTVPAEEVVGAEVRAEYAAAVQANTDRQRAIDLDTSLAASLEVINRQGKELGKQLDALRAERAEVVRQLSEASQAVLAAQPVDVAEIETRIGAVDEVNVRVRKQAERAAIAAELADRTAEEAKLNDRIDEVDKVKADGLAAAAFPAGLSLDDTGIVHNGIPFRQLNSAQQDTIAFDLATSAKPDLRIVVMKSGDRLDDVRLAAIQKLAEARAYFVFMERDRGDSREVGFVVADKVVTK